MHWNEPRGGGLPASVCVCMHSSSVGREGWEHMHWNEPRGGGLPSISVCVWFMHSSSVGREGWEHMHWNEPRGRGLPASVCVCGLCIPVWGGKAGSICTGTNPEGRPTSIIANLCGYIELENRLAIHICADKHREDEYMQTYESVIVLP